MLVSLHLAVLGSHGGFTHLCMYYIFEPMPLLLMEFLEIEWLVISSMQTWISVGIPVAKSLQHRR